MDETGSSDESESPVIELSQHLSEVSLSSDADFERPMKRARFQTRMAIHQHSLSSPEDHQSPSQSHGADRSSLPHGRLSSLQGGISLSPRLSAVHLSSLCTGGGGGDIAVERGQGRAPASNLVQGPFPYHYIFQSFHDDGGETVACLAWSQAHPFLDWTFRFAWLPDDQTFANSFKEAKRKVSSVFIG